MTPAHQGTLGPLWCPACEQYPRKFEFIDGATFCTISLDLSEQIQQLAGSQKLCFGYLRGQCCDCGGIVYAVNASIVSEVVSPGWRFRDDKTWHAKQEQRYTVQGEGCLWCLGHHTDVTLASGWVVWLDVHEFQPLVHLQAGEDIRDLAQSVIDNLLPHLVRFQWQD